MSYDKQMALDMMFVVYSDSLKNKKVPEMKQVRNEMHSLGSKHS